MIVIEREGEYVPSALAAQLRDAGIDVRGVTCTETDPTETTPAKVESVQIVCADGTTEKAVDEALAGYVAPDPDAYARAAKQAEIRAALASTDWWHLRDAEGGKKMTAKQKQYRAALRDIHEQAKTAKSADDIALPAPPREGRSGA